MINVIESHPSEHARMLTIEALRAGDVAEADGLAQIDVQITLGESRHMHSTGIFSFSVACNSFARNAKKRADAILIIDDDDALHIRCKVSSDRYSCALRCSDEELASCSMSFDELYGISDQLVSRVENIIADQGYSELWNSVKPARSRGSDPMKVSPQ